LVVLAPQIATKLLQEQIISKEIALNFKRVVEE
jgi:hypothetical protein